MSETAGAGRSAEAWGRGLGWAAAAVGLAAVSGWLLLVPTVVAPPGEGLAAVVGVLGILADALPVLVVMWLAAMGLGRLWGKRGASGAGLGMASLLLAQYVVSLTLGIGGGWAWGLIAAGVMALGVDLWRRRSERAKHGRGHWRPSWGWLVGMPGLGWLVVAACCPPGTMWAVEAFGYDATSYHLQIPREWVAAGAMRELEHNVYGYLPGLMESGYAMVFSLRGGKAVASVYVCQLLHASFAVVMAAATAELLRGRVRPMASAVGGAVTLVVPWVVVTGSLAYNELAVLAFAAAGLHLVLGPGKPSAKDAAAVGLLAAAATLAKLTAGFTVALPLGALLVWRLWREAGPRRLAAPVAICVGIGLISLSPYLLRNLAWTGNPVFPFATSSLGLGHWEPAQAERWAEAHQPDVSVGERFSAIWRQAIGNAGYGALGGSETPAETQNVARFDREGGFPTLWLAAAAGLGLSTLRREGRWFVWAAAGLIGWQVVWWLVGTHLQSRFLVLVILPLGWGVGLWIEALLRLPGGLGARAGGIAAGVLGALLGAAGLATISTQATKVPLDNGQRVPAPLWLLVDGLPAPLGRGVLSPPPINELLPGARVAVVGNNQGLFYLQRDFVYASAFDAPPIRDALAGDPAADEFARRLRNQGITHLWLGYSELDRLHATYGFDPAVTSGRLRRLVADWPAVTPPAGPSVLVAVPGS